MVEEKINNIYSARASNSIRPRSPLNVHSVKNLKEAKNKDKDDHLTNSNTDGRYIKVTSENLGCKNNS
jgi:hypothetical protein